MKGIVFNEFINMVETVFDEDMVDDIMDSVDLASGGAYTSVGTYSHEELVVMVVELSNRCGTPVPDLINAFGKHLAKVFSVKYADFFNECPDTLSFLKKIDNHIHVEVKKLYPDAELPEFSYDDSDPDNFQLIYSSVRGFSDLAEGLIEGSAQHYGESFNIAREVLEEGDNHRVKFILGRA